MPARMETPIPQAICTETGTCISNIARRPVVVVALMRGTALDRKAATDGTRAMASTNANVKSN